MTATYRMTQQRKQILDYLARAEFFPTAKHIFDAVREVMPSISFGTIYRNLSILKQIGLVRELTLDSDVRRYDIQTKDHAHFRCRECGNELDVAPKGLMQQLQDVMRELGARDLHYYLELTGVCATCATNA